MSDMNQQLLQASTCLYLEAEREHQCSRTAEGNRNISRLRNTADESDERC
jgi:hypothetical protein